MLVSGPKMLGRDGIETSDTPRDRSRILARVLKSRRCLPAPSRLEGSIMNHVQRINPLVAWVRFVYFEARHEKPNVALEGVINPETPRLGEPELVGFIIIPPSPPLSRSI